MLDMMTVQFGTVFPDGLHDVKNEMVEELYHRELKIVAGVADVLSALKASGISMSIGSNSPRKRVKLAVELTGIATYFDRIITYQDVDHGKPAPDIFLHAVKLAGVTTSECRVVEDSVTGMTAATSAGIRSVGFSGTHAHPAEHAQSLKAAGAAVVIERMSDLLHSL
jgi:HAD superfamily hydrolase (TIGR01509 family)